MKRFFLNAVACMGMFMSISSSHAQFVDLGGSAQFAVFTAAGAFNNDGLTVVTGDIGTNVGAFAGFPPGIVIGDIYLADPVTAQAAVDVDEAYSALVAMQCGLVIGTTLGNGQILLPNIYCLGAASVLNETLTLDGQGDPNSIFIFQIDGALSSNTFSNIVLINGADACNVYWQVNGAVSLGDSTTFIGTIVANGAISLLEGTSLMGRALTRQGAIDLHNNQVTLSSLVPVAGDISADGSLSFCQGDSVILSGNVGGTWSTGAETSSITVFTSGDYYVVNTNGCGSDTSNIITVTVGVDLFPPIITCPPNITLNCDESTDPINTGTATASDDCDTDPTIAYTDVITDGACAQAYSIARTWISIDSGGNTSTCVQDIIVTDSNAPSITCPIVDTSIECGTAPDFGTATSLDICDPSVDITFVTDSIPGGCAQEYSLTRIWTATDDCGNTATCSVTIVVQDNTVPQLTCPTVISLIECGSVPNFGVATATDDCDPSVDISFVTDSIPGTCAQEYSLIRTWTAMDDCGNMSTCSRTISVQDNTPPVITCPAVLSPIDCGTIPSFGTATATDACDASVDITFSTDSIPGECPQLFIVTRTWIATDDCGNTSTCSATIITEDTTAPVINCPALTPPVECGSMPPFGEVTATDNCDAQVEITFITDSIPGSCGQSYSLTRTWTATDDCGNTATCSLTVDVEDTVPPVIICPIVDTEIECGTIPFFGTPSVTDACDASVDITFVTDSMPGECAQEYSLTRIWTATDDCGNTATCSVTIVVQDNTVPQITCPTVISLIECGSVPLFGVAIATDDCDPTVDITFVTDSIPGNCVQEYSLIRTWTAIDDCGNVSTCSRTISVQDNTPPVITCPTVLSPIDCGAIPSFGTATATDACDASVDITFSTDSVPGECPQLFIVTRTWIATDDCGNTSTCSATIIIEDTTAPVINCPGLTPPVECGSVPPFGEVTATDNCDAQVEITFTTDSIPGACGQSYSLTRTWTATDDCGNTATCSLTIEVEDTLPPVIICPIVDTDIECGTIPFFGTPSVTDACDASVDITFVTDSMPGECAQEYSLTRIWTATDDCGNTASCSVTILVQDNTVPQITCPTVISLIECGSVPLFGVAIATDDCDPSVDITFVTDSIPGTCAQEYSLIRTWTAMDDCGNMSTCSRTISVQDNTPPVITCPVVLSPIACGTTPSFGNATATDACDASVDISFVTNTVAGVCPQISIVTRIWTATDDCGNTSSCSAVIIIEDNVPPLINCPVVLSPIPCGAIPNFGTATATDLCDANVVITFVTNQIAGACALEYTAIRTWTATDDCGNTSTCSRTIVVGGNTDIMITCPAGQSVSCAEQVPPVNTSLVVVTGNCGAVTVTHVGDIVTNQSCLNSFTLTRTYLATDICGYTASCTQIINVSDIIPPTILFTNPLFDQNGDTLEVQCYGQDPEWDIPLFDESSVNAMDNCGGEVEVEFSRVLEDQGDCMIDGYIILYRLTWTATDACGNSSTAYVFEALVDTIPPVLFNIPDNITVDCSSIFEVPEVYATDECLCACIVAVTVSDTTQQECQDGLIVYITWTAKDDCGNETSATQTVTLVDDQGPEIIITEPEISGVTDGTIFEYTCMEGGIPDFYGTLNVESISVLNSCGAAASVDFERHTDISRNCEVTGYMEVRTYQWTAIDLCGNATTLTIEARLIDDEAPVIVDLPEFACIGDPSLNNVEVYDNCENVSLRYWNVNIPNPCGPGTAVRRTYEAYDDCGNITTDTTILLPNTLSLPIIHFTDTLMENMLPDQIMTITCEAMGHQYTPFSIEDVIIEGECTSGATVRFAETVLSTGDCIGGGVMALVELRWRVIDVCGNTVERIVYANIIDQSGPVFHNFSPVLYVGCTDSIPSMSATDNCGEVLMTHLDEIVPGTCADQYDIKRIITATDECGNISTREQIIHVGDGSGPTFIGLLPEICDDLTIPIVTAYDACADEFVDVTMTQDTLVDICRDGEVIQRTWTAIDACGDTSIFLQTIIINDHTPPVIYVPSYSIIHQFIDHENDIIYMSEDILIRKLNDLNGYSVSVYDDCDQLIIPEFSVDTLFALDCEASGYAQRRTYTWIVTDICGNTSSITFTVDIIDDIPPVFGEVVFDSIIICAPLPLASIVEMIDSTESVLITYTEVIVPGPNEGQHTVTRTWTAIDSCHNITTYIQTILWQPESLLECEILLPPTVDCNEHGVIITSLVSGGTDSLTYEWQVVGEKCFIQGGQGTPGIQLYVGWSDVKIILMVTDTFGCVSMCMTTLTCTETSPLVHAELDNPIVIEASPVPYSPPTKEVTDATILPMLSQLNLWPNPVQEELTISFESSAQNDVQIRVRNYLGHVVVQDKLTATKGLNTHRLDVHALPNGSYLLQVKTEKELYTEIIIILHNE